MSTTQVTPMETERRAIIALARAWIARNGKAWTDFLPRDVVEELARICAESTLKPIEKVLYPERSE